jgi:hypothetical protein
MTTVSVPFDTQFLADFMPAPELAMLADELVSECEDLHPIHQHEITIQYLWKRKGGTAGGRERYGNIQAMSGLLRFFGQASFAVWLAADHLRRRSFDDRKIEAQLFHELMRIAIEEDDESGIVTIGLRSPDVHAFLPEIARYGLWSTGLEEAGPTLRQAALNLEGIGPR